MRNAFSLLVRRLLLLTTLALAIPAPASAGLTSLEVREVSLAGVRTESSAAAESPFQLVGVHWQGPGSVALRTRSIAGRWSPWRLLDEADHDAPDAGSAEGRRARAWRKSAPVWVGSATRVELRIQGRVLRARTLTVRSPVSLVPLRTTAAAGAPRIVTRAVWQADESIRRAKPSYADALVMAHIHHTAGTNAYGPEQAPAIVRAIQTYHVKGNGWNDIGYNALVDRFGTVYEGRFGGIDRNVVGAHARGFNTGSFGIAVLGDFRAASPTSASVDALVRTLAWRLDLAHVDPLGTFNGISSGNERFNPGIPVFLRAISGHRDTGLTTCPGETLYAQIPAIATRVAALGLPKIYAPSVRTDETGGVRLTARLSSALPWTAIVRDPAGLELGRATGARATVDWVWRPASPIPAGSRWRIETPGATAAEGVLAGTATVAVTLTGASATPSTISPNGDGQADAAVIAFTLGANANVSVAVLDPAGAAVVELEPRTWRRAGARTVTFDGAGLADGVYTVRILARGTGGREATVDVPVSISRLLGRLALDAEAFTPNGDGRNDVLSLALPLTAPANVTVRIVRDGRWVATPFTGPLEPGDHTVRWDGTKRLGRAQDGTYAFVVEATDGVLIASAEVPFVLDATAPVVRVVSVSPPRLFVSEAAVVVMRVNNARRLLRPTGPGTVRIPRVERLRTLVLRARDAAGNESTLRR